MAFACHQCKSTFIRYLLIALVFYLTFVKKLKQTASFELILEGIEPESAWKYYSNFSNVKKMNPTIFDYKILSGDMSSHYSVLYKETMVHTDYFTNEIMGYYQAYPSGQRNGKHIPYQILSTHNSCQFGFCLYSTDKMFFMDADRVNATKIIEHFEYECQIVLTLLCKSEFLGQRKLIYDNMKIAHLF